MCSGKSTMRKKKTSVMIPAGITIKAELCDSLRTSAWTGPICKNGYKPGAILGNI